MTTSIQDREFLNELIPGCLLETAIEWISSNMSPEDVFSENDLAYWATSNGFVEEQ